MKHAALSTALSSLIAERSELDKAIVALQSLAGASPAPKPRAKKSTPVQKRKRHYTVAQRETFRVAAIKRWETRRANAIKDTNGDLASAPAASV